MKQKIRDFLHLFGIDITLRPKYNGSSTFEIDGFSYGFSTPTANLTPWDGDEDFKKIYAIVRNRFTLVDIYRCYELWQLVEKAYELSPSAGILEVGVWRGGTSAIMAEKLKTLHANTPIFMADTFTGVAKATKEDKFYVGGEHCDTSEQLVTELMIDTVGYKNFTILKGIFPEDTQHLITSVEQFSLCHIDVDVYASAKDILEWIWGKLIIGGMIVFDDYGFHTCVGITKFVEEHRHKTDRVIIHNLNGHAIIVKIGNQIV